VELIDGKVLCKGRRNEDAEVKDNVEGKGGKERWFS
jgi:hypothetical protein